MKKIILPTALFFLMTSLVSFAQTTDGSLKSCIEYGLQHFGTVRIARNQTEAAHQQARQAAGAYQPQVSGTGNFTDNVKLQTTVFPAGLAGPEPLRIKIGSKYQTSVSAQVTQVVYDQALLLGLKAAGPNQQLAELNTRQTREDIIYNITTHYYQVLVAQQQIALLSDHLQRTQRVLDILKLQRDNGVIQPVDYNRTEVSYNSTRSQLALAQNDQNLALNRLKYQMGLSQEQVLPPVDSALLRQVPLFEQTRFEARNLVTYQKAEANLSLQRLQLQHTRAGYLPTLNFTANYGMVMLANDFGNAFNTPLGFGSVGLRLNVPIFDGFQRDAQVQQARLTVQNQEEEQRLNTASYQLQYANAQSQIQRAQANLQNDERNVKLAQEVYTITTVQYKQGTKSLTDLLNTDDSYRQSQSNYLQSLIDFYQARLDLEQAQGTLLDFYKQL